MATQLDIISIDGSVHQLIAVDIGNSAIKFYLNGQLLRFSYRTNWEESINSLLRSLSQRLCLFVISSVNTEKYDSLIDKITVYSTFRTALVSNLLLDQKFVDISLVKGIGNDRILGIIGAMRYSAPPLLTIDCGTATTINLVDENRVFQGGAILPGIFTQFRSLIESTSALKKIKLIKVDEPWGKITNEAISSGILYGTIGTIKEFINSAKDTLNSSEFSIFVTGGNSIWIADKLKDWNPKINHILTLTQEGIINLAMQHFLA